MSIEKLDFQKVTKDKTPYTVLLNSVIQNIPNATALGVWSYLYSLPPDWEINKNQIKDKFDIGSKMLKNIFSYFIRSNLAVNVARRDSKGKILRHDVHLLNGENFDKTSLFIEDQSTGSKTSPMDNSAENPQGQKSTGWRNHRGGKETPTKETQLQRKNKKQKKEDFAMSNKNEQIKFKPVPPGSAYVERNTVSDEYLKFCQKTAEDKEKADEARKKAMTKIRGKR